jgi:serine/threonine protein kinase
MRKECQQLAVDPRRAPTRIIRLHSADESPDLVIDCGPPEWPGAQTPEPPETGGIGDCGEQEPDHHQSSYAILTHAGVRNVLIFRSDSPSLKSPAGELLGQMAAELAPRQTLAQYRVEAKLGEGGMGAVYLAYDMKLRRHVALKVLPPGRLADAESKQQLLREARAASAPNHPNIVTMHEIGSDAGVDFIAMELVEGKTLKEAIPAKGLPLGKALDYAVQIAAGLAKAHAAGIIHCDLKPGNVMVTSDGLVKLLDFGLARRVRVPESGTTVTVAGGIAGTPAYMSPEQARGEDVDARTDLFSFGAVLYEMVTGKRAFSGTSSAVVFDAIMHQAPTSPIRLTPDCPAELERIINKGLEKDREERYPTAAEMGAELKRCLDARIAVELSAPEPRTFLRAVRKPGIAVPAGVCLAVRICRKYAPADEEGFRFQFEPCNVMPRSRRLAR